jgi:inner membrane protein involved in colicin E2 resistance
VTTEHFVLQGARAVGVITAVLAGSTAGLVAILASDHSLAAALLAGAVVALAALVALMRFQRSAWEQAATMPLIADEDEGPS